jgi:hypothetical protein
MSTWQITEEGTNCLRSIAIHNENQTNEGLDTVAIATTPREDIGCRDSLDATVSAY